MHKHNQSEWQIQQAKQCFSEVIRRAEKEGPQQITKNGVESAWIISPKDYHRLQKKKKGIVEFFQESPHLDVSWFRLEPYI